MLFLLRNVAMGFLHAGMGRSPFSLGVEAGNTGVRSDNYYSISPSFMRRRGANV